MAAVSEDSADAAEHDVYALWRRIRCPLAGIAMPVTYLAGTWDAITSAEDMRAASKNTPNSEYVELPATHYLPLQFSERVATELRRVIDRCSL